MESIVMLLLVVFLVLLFIVCGKKGFRSLLSLVLTIILLIWVIIPLILKGYSPTLVILFTALPILILIIYLTEGLTTLSHLSVVGVFLNFLLISLLTHLTVLAAHLTGLVSDDASYLGLTGISLQQLLIGGIMLGTLGILTEMVVTQVATVMEFIQADTNAGRKQIYKQTYNVGIAHLGSIINTLFLVYAGVSFPLLIIYVGGNSSLYSALHYEPLVSDIIRTLVGTIGLIVAMPTSTFLACWWLKRPGYKIESDKL